MRDPWFLRLPLYTTTLMIHVAAFGNLWDLVRFVEEDR